MAGYASSCAERHEVPAAGLVHFGGRSAARRGSGIWTDNLQPAAGARMNGKPEAVQLDDSYHEVETESDARRVTHLVGTIEAPQYGLALLFADAGAGIGHAHDGLAVIAQQAHIDSASVGRELDRIVDQVGDRLDQQIPVATHIEILFDVNPQGDILVLG